MAIRFMIGLLAALVSTLGLANASTVAGEAAVKPTISNLYSFTGGADCGEPDGPLLRDPRGVLFGLTTGGFPHCNGGTIGAGVLFELVPHGNTFTFEIAHNFKGGSTDVTPHGPLAMDASGALYAVNPGSGCGTIEKFTPARRGYDARIIFIFDCERDGSPNVGLLLDSSGALYGTTWNGGSSKAGEVYKLTPANPYYTQTLLHTFGALGDGQNPLPGLAFNRAGNLFGSTYIGPDFMYGSVYEVSPSPTLISPSEQIIYRFGIVGDTEGTTPTGPLLVDSSGEVFGETTGGGSKCGTYGCGVVYRLTPAEHGYVASVLHSFGSWDQLGSLNSGLTEDRNEEIYGVFGGEFDDENGLFTLTPARGGYAARAYKVDNTKYSGINAPLVLGPDRTLYGTSFFGGVHGLGSVFTVHF